MEGEDFRFLTALGMTGGGGGVRNDGCQGLSSVSYQFEVGFRVGARQEGPPLCISPPSSGGEIVECGNDDEGSPHVWASDELRRSHEELI